jgi:DNA-directed RNA polymerase specialized sigma24 family protein
VASRDDAEFVEFVSAFEPRLRRTAYLLLGDRAAAADLVRESLVRVYVGWSSLERHGGLPAHALRVVVTTAMHHRRSPPHEQPKGSARSDLTRSDLTLSDLTLSDLAPRQRACVVLRCHEGLSESEAAELLNCSTGTVHSQTRAGLELLGTTDPSAALQESAEEPEGGGLLSNPYTLLEDGKKRVRRRRLLATSGTAAATLAVVLAAALGGMGSTPPPPGPVPNGDGSFQKVEVGRSEAISRCLTQLHNGDHRGSFVLLDAVTTANGLIVGQPQPPWYEGSQLYFTPKSHGSARNPLPRICTVPQEKMTALSGVVPQHVATATDVDAFRAQCGAFAGIDLDGWRAAAAATDTHGSIAVFASRNGYTLSCEHIESSAVDTAFTVQLGALHGSAARGAPVQDYRGGQTVAVSCQPPPRGSGEPGVCFGAGEAYDQGPVASLKVTLPDGGAKQVAPVRGFYAFVFDVPAPVPWSRYLGTQITVISPQNRPVNSYPVQPLPAEVTVAAG